MAALDSKLEESSTAIWREHEKYFTGQKHCVGRIEIKYLYNRENARALFPSEELEVAVSLLWRENKWVARADCIIEEDWKETGTEEKYAS